MAQITKEQADALADRFLDLARAVDDFAFEHRDTLSGEDKEKLGRKRKALSDQANRFTVEAISIALDDLASVLARLGDVTKQAAEAVRTIADVGRAINIVNSALAAGIAVATGNAVGIGPAILDLASKVQG